MADTAGYSGKPLVVKLGMKPGWRVRAIDPPEHLEGLVSPLPNGAALVDDPDAELTWLFVRTRAALERQGPDLVGTVGRGAMLWVSWPKKSSALFVDLTEDGVREVMLPTGLVDVKVCAVDQDWSGLKLVRRRA